MPSYIVCMLGFNCVQTRKLIQKLYLKYSLSTF